MALGPGASLATVAAVDVGGVNSGSATASSLAASVKDEYDPMRPNDYEEV